MTRHIENQSHQSVVEHPKRKRRLGHAVALGGSVLAMMGNPAEGEAMETASARADMSVAAQAVFSLETAKPPKANKASKPKPLLRLEQLPGFNVSISPERQQELQQSIVKIVWRAKGSGSDWKLYNTGAMIERVVDPDAQKGGPVQKLVITSNHGFDMETGVSEGTLPDDSVPAKDYVHTSFYEYGVVDPLVPYSEGEKLQPFATFAGLSLSHRGEDIALGMPVPVENVDGLPSVGRTLDNFPALKFSKSLNSYPRRGMEVGVSGWPAAASRPVVGTGRFLGRIKYPNWLGNEGRLDVVAIDTDTQNPILGKLPGGPRSDSCHYGASGSVAIGEDFITGPLAMRLNKTYDPEYIVENFDQIPRTSFEFKQAAAERRKNIIKWWKITESRLGVSIPKSSDTLCFYEVDEIDKKTGQDNITDLYQGFGNYATPK